MKHSIIAGIVLASIASVPAYAGMHSKSSTGMSHSQMSKTMTAAKKSGNGLSGAAHVGGLAAYASSHHDSVASYIRGETDSIDINDSESLRAAYQAHHAEEMHKAYVTGQEEIAIRASAPAALTAEQVQTIHTYVGQVGTALALGKLSVSQVANMAEGFLAKGTPVGTAVGTMLNRIATNADKNRVTTVQENELRKLDSKVYAAVPTAVTQLTPTPITQLEPTKVLPEQRVPAKPTEDVIYDTGFRLPAQALTDIKESTTISTADRMDIARHLASVGDGEDAVRVIHDAMGIAPNAPTGDADPLLQQALDGKIVDTTQPKEMTTAVGGQLLPDTSAQNQQLSKQDADLLGVTQPDQMIAPPSEKMVVPTIVPPTEKMVTPPKSSAWVRNQVEQKRTAMQINAAKVTPPAIEGQVAPKVAPIAVPVTEPMLVPTLTPHQVLPTQKVPAKNPAWVRNQVEQKREAMNINASKVAPPVVQESIPVVKQLTPTPVKQMVPVQVGKVPSVIKHPTQVVANDGSSDIVFVPVTKYCSDINPKICYDNGVQSIKDIVAKHSK